MGLSSDLIHLRIASPQTWRHAAFDAGEPLGVLTGVALKLQVHLGEDCYWHNCAFPTMNTVLLYSYLTHEGVT
jgi:hypothetical protein